MLPNSSSFFVRRWAAAIVSYGNQIGLHMAWNFYSPDPAHMMYFKYQVLFLDDYGVELGGAVENFVPPEITKIAMNSSQRRQLYSMRYFVLANDRIEDLLVPWVCRNHPGSSHVLVSHFFIQQPNLDKALSAPLDSFRGLFVEQKNYARKFSCEDAFKVLEDK